MGAEDWVSLDLDYGQVFRFHGSLLMHFTTENRTPWTRISLDFRVIPGTLFGVGRSHFAEPGYFVRAERSGDGRDGDTGTADSWAEHGPGAAGGAERSHKGEWTRVGDLPVPDARCGFPFTKK